jgi:hypothetical protein
MAGAGAAGWFTGRGDLAQWIPAAMNLAQLFRPPPSERSTGGGFGSGSGPLP